MSIVARVFRRAGASQAPALGSQTTGDSALAASVRAMWPGAQGCRGLSVVVIETGVTRYAGLGAASGDGEPVLPGTPFEIGSVTKALTGMLLADMAADGTVRVDEPLRALLPDVEFTDPGVADNTLAELASHRSGLPRLRFTGLRQAFGMSLRSWRGEDPYAGQDTAWLLSTVGTATGSRKRAVAYSNYGMSVLGHALASRAGVPYPDLIQRRILDPLGMTDTGFRLDGAAPPPGAARGSTAGGRNATPWTASGYAPAGCGAWSTAADLAKLVSAMLAGTAPGADAATPRFDENASRRVGYGWFTDHGSGREITWHNGGTGGFRSIVCLELAAQRGAVVLSNTDRVVDELGLRLLGPAPGRDDEPGPGPAT